MLGFRARALRTAPDSGFRKQMYIKNHRRVRLKGVKKNENRSYFVVLNSLAKIDKNEVITF
jgi:hypothetical protein